MIPSRGHHVSFSVSDLEASLAFYRDVLGLEPIERPDFGLPGAWLEAPGRIERISGSSRSENLLS